MKKIANVCGATPSTTLFVGDLSILCVTNDLEQTFGPFQAVDIEILQETKVVSYAFVTFKTVEQAGFAMFSLNNKQLLGRNFRFDCVIDIYICQLKYP